MNDITRCPRDGYALTYTVERPSPSLATTRATCAQCGGAFGMHTLLGADLENDGAAFFRDDHLIGVLQRRMLDGMYDADPFMEYMHKVEASPPLSTPPHR